MPGIMTKKPRVLLIYGSVTGKAESIAELIAEEGEKRGFEIDLKCMSTVGRGVHEIGVKGFCRGGKMVLLFFSQFNLESEPCVVMVSSTTGDGDQPENAEKLWRKIKKRALPEDHLAKMRFAQLGLGDSNYSQFCNGPKTLHERLLDLGAEPFYEPAWADDGVGYK